MKRHEVGSVIFWVIGSLVLVSVVVVVAMLLDDTSEKCEAGAEFWRANTITKLAIPKLELVETSNPAEAVDGDGALQLKPQGSLSGAELELIMKRPVIMRGELSLLSSSFKLIVVSGDPARDGDLTKYDQARVQQSRTLNQGLKGGKKVSKLSLSLQRNYDWNALITLKYPDSELAVCSGALIDKKWVITAAHCIEPKNGAPMPPNSAVYIGGVSQAGDRGDRHLIETAYLPKCYTAGGKKKHLDIALLELLKESALSTLEIDSTLVQLQSEPRTRVASGGQPVTLVGWGKAGIQNPADIGTNLQHALSKTSSKAECVSANPDTNVDWTLFCAGGASASGSVIQGDEGDSGGPALKLTSGKMALLGTAVQSEIATTGSPTLYVRTSAHLGNINKLVLNQREH